MSLLLTLFTHQLSIIIVNKLRFAGGRENMLEKDDFRMRTRCDMPMMHSSVMTIVEFHSESVEILKKYEKRTTKQHNKIQDLEAVPPIIACAA